MEVSMTTFLDFVSKAGNPKITCVRVAKEQYGQEYERARDYWLPLRNSIVSMHAASGDSDQLDVVVKNAHPKKAANYKACVKQYKRWMRGKRFSGWESSSSVLWSSGGLNVRVNPELVLSVDGKPRVVKLYFKAEKLTATRSSAGLALLHSTWGNKGKVGLLEVQRGILHEMPPSASPGQAVLLAGEAAMFVALWNEL